MKKILFIFLATMGVLNLLGQTPYQINYQGIARNSLGNVLPNQNISLRLSILDGSATGSLLYQEVRELKTNYFGMFNVAIGSSGATYQIGTLSTVNWNTGGAKFLQVEMDLNGGSNFIKMGASQLQSVPYAFVAGKASPSGPAGGALSGTYPNPDLSNGAVTNSKIADGSITTSKVAANAIDDSKLADNAVTTEKITDASVTAAKLAPGVIPTSLTPSGNAGGDLSGTYPNPTVKDGAIITTKVADGAISANKIADNAIGNSKLADNAVTTTKITDASVTAAKLAPGVIPSSLTPSGTAGGDLSGTYPNPSVASIRGTTISNAAPVTGQVLKFDGTQWTPAAESAGAAGTAGGDLTGTYPNPTVAANAIDNTKLADNAITTTKITDASVTAAKLAPGVIPTSLTPSGTAGGDLAGSYPNPSVAQIRGKAISSTAPASGQALIFNGTQWAPATISASASGTAGGDLTGTYPNPTVAANAIDNTKLANNAVTTAKITDASVTAAKLAPGVIPTSLTPSGTAGGDLAGSYPNPSVASIRGTTISNTAPAVGQVLKFDGTQWTPAAESAGASGTAGGDLTGTYPNPSVAANAIDNTKLADNAVTTTKITDASVTAAKLAPGVIPTSLTPSGAAGGDLSGTYPNPTVAANAIDNSKLADNAVTTAKITDASVTAAKLAPGVIPTSLTPSGTAGGDLAGNYPNPSVAQIQGTAVSNTAPAAGQVLTFNGSQWAPANITSGSSAPSGPAGGDLSGTYPNPNIASGAITTSKIANGSIVTPKLVDGAVTTNKIADGAVTAAKLAPGLIPSSLPPSGTAGGDLAGSYPNPSVASIRGNTISNTTPTAGQVLKFDGTQWTPAAESASASGSAGGDLTGTYPNPTVATSAIDNTKLADNAVTTSKITDASVTAAKLAPGVIPTSLTPSGTAGGDLAGSYPNPSVAQIRGTAISSTAPSSGQALIFNGTQWAPATISASASGTAGGDLTGTYPNPSVAANAIDNSKLADNAVTTTKITDASVTAAKLAPGVIPTSLTPSGTAGGDLGGTYPNPTVTQIQGTAVSNTAPASGQVLKFNGTQWAPAAEAAGGGSLTLPYSASQAATTSLFSITNSGAGNALEGINSSTNAGAFGIEGKITSTSPGTGSAAIKGTIEAQVLMDMAFGVHMQAAAMVCMAAQ